MRDGGSDKRQLKERDQQIAQMLTTLVTICERIERVKQKICGFSAAEFLPEEIYEVLDLDGKGFVSSSDVAKLLDNENISDNDILLLFRRLNSSEETLDRLTYLGYLSMIKPYFDRHLAQDLLLRDKLARPTRDSGLSPRLFPSQTAVLLLVKELFLLQCVCTSEHERQKKALSAEHMLNSSEYRQIVGLDRDCSLASLYHFIDTNGSYSLPEGDMKYLLAYLQTSESGLSSQQTLGLLFMPVWDVDCLVKNREMYTETHTEQRKSYLNQKDLLSSQRNFLNYIHPKSIQRSPAHYTTQSAAQTPQEQPGYTSASRLQPRHYEQSQNEPSITNEPRASCWDTPLLMQFMKDSNIAKNLSKNASNISSIQDSQLSAFEGHFSGRRPSDQLPLPSMNSPLPTINEADKLIGNSHHQQMFQSNASSNPSRSLNPKERRIPFGEKSLLDEFLIQR